MSSIPVDPVIQLTVKEWLVRIDGKLDAALDRITALEQSNKVRAGVVKFTGVALSTGSAVAGIIYSLVRLHG